MSATLQQSANWSPASTPTVFLSGWAVSYRKPSNKSRAMQLIWSASGGVRDYLIKENKSYGIFSLNGTSVHCDFLTSSELLLHKHRDRAITFSKANDTLKLTCKSHYFPFLHNEAITSAVLQATLIDSRLSFTFDQVAFKSGELSRPCFDARQIVTPVQKVAAGFSARSSWGVADDIKLQQGIQDKIKLVLKQIAATGSLYD